MQLTCSMKAIMCLICFCTSASLSAIFFLRSFLQNSKLVDSFVCLLACFSLKNLLTTTILSLYNIDCAFDKSMAFTVITAVCIIVMQILKHAGYSLNEMALDRLPKIHSHANNPKYCVLYATTVQFVRQECAKII